MANLNQLINLIGKNYVLQTAFNFVGFWTLRLFKPLEYFIIRELINCGSILDLGVGPHSMIGILPDSIFKYGVEAHLPSYVEARRSQRFDAVICDDIRTFNPRRQYDAVVMLDVIEHLTMAEGLEMIKKMESWATKKIIIFTPNGYLEQEERDHNEFQAHRSGWTASDFKRLGFKVYGVRGFKWLKDRQTKQWQSGWINLTQIITYWMPEKAFQIIAIKTYPQNNNKISTEIN